MSYFASKLSNYTGQTDTNRLKDYLVMVDIDLQNLFQASSIFNQFGTGSSYSILTYTSTNYMWFPTVGAWNITNELLYGGAGANYIGLKPGTGIWMGDETFASAVFSVDPTGQMIAHAGRIGGWYIGTTTLSSTNIVFDSFNQRIESSDFISGTAGRGWRISPTTAEFGDIRARGKITTSVFEKETISSVGGNMLVMDADVLTASMTALDTEVLTISGDTIFATGDILRIKDGVDDEWFEITGSTSAYVYQVTRDKAGNYGADLNPEWEQGVAVVNYGASGRGGIMLSSSEATSPYIDFFLNEGSPWVATTGKTRIGNLSGIAGCTGYGIWAGSGYLANLQVIDIISIASSGYIRSNISGSYPYVEMSNDGVQLKDSDTGGTYGTAVYGTDRYGFGALAWIMNPDLGVPWAELKIPKLAGEEVASLRLYNRTGLPSGTALAGDLCVVGGTLYICTGGGTPGTWAAV